MRTPAHLKSCCGRFDQAALLAVSLKSKTACCFWVAFREATKALAAATTFGVTSPTAAADAAVPTAVAPAPGDPAADPAVVVAPAEVPVAPAEVPVAPAEVVV